MEDRATAAEKHLLGTWHMLSWTRESLSTGEIGDAMGPDPVGYIAYHGDGRMMATVFRRDRPEQLWRPLEPGG
jgi:hypothetical protein